MNLGIVVPSFNRYPKTKRFLRCLEAQTDNDDAIIKPDFLQKMKEIYERNHCRILGARIDYANEPVKIWTLGGSCNWEGKHLYQPADFTRREYSRYKAELTYMRIRWEKFMERDPYYNKNRIHHSK